MQEEQRRILKLVESGMLTAEEAILLLEKLHDSGEGEKKEQEQERKKGISEQVEYDRSRQQFSSDSKQSVKHKFMDFLDSAFKKVKDMDLDFNFGSAVEVKHIFQHSDVYITMLDLDVANGSVTIVPWNEKDVRVECEAKVYKIENQERARKAFLEDVLFSIDGGQLRLSIQKKQMKVHAKIFVPQESYENVKIRMFNGPISAENLFVANFEAKTANGTISLDSVKAVSLDLETANGHIKASRMETKDFEAETINGTITADGNFEMVDFQSFNGNITCTLQAENCHKGYAKTTTGSIEFLISDEYMVEGELKSNLGSFRTELPHMTTLEEKKDVVQKSLRFIANEEKNHKLHLLAETKTGSITVKPL